MPPGSNGPAAAAIELCGVRKEFGRKVAVDSLSLSVPEGELFACLGPNGAGKTTTIKMIVGLLRPTAGTVHVFRHAMNLNGSPAKAMMAYVPDLPFCYGKLTGREFLHFVAEMYGLSKKARDARLEELAARLDTHLFLDTLTESYSHGMKQKLVLSAALLHDPRLLVIDEPMVGLDPRTVRAVKDLFRERTRAGMTVFMSTHTLEVAEAIADRIGIIDHGRLVAVGTLEELRRAAEHRSTLEEIFLRLTDGAAGATGEAVPLP